MKIYIFYFDTDFITVLYYVPEVIRITGWYKGHFINV